MTAKKGLEGKWRQTTVLLRDDILAGARASGLDIGDICNQALAAATGIRYDRKKPADTVLPGPVIIAGTGATTAQPSAPRKAAEPPGPVINADDPRSPGAVKQAERKPVRKVPPALPGRVSAPEKPRETPPEPSEQPVPLKTPPSRKPAPSAVKKAKGSAIRTFVAGVVTRELVGECHVTKDDLYEAFARWCREHRVTPVPDRKAVTVALKNQFAIKEETVDGRPSWLNIRLKM